ncbi:MAG TPA: hypothetical protein VHK69_05135 [Chitinophagaceae bacterium]|jgi:hypothetical protein|nr:hypothetical protein [Chitinophagaceae bacterium]
MLRLLKVRLIVDGKAIYMLPRKRPIVIDLDGHQSRLVVTNGFHCTQELQLPEYPAASGYFLVTCTLSNNLLAACGLLLGVFYLVGLLSDILLVRLLSFLPLLYFLYHFYLNRKCFLVIRAIGPVYPETAS